VRQAFQGSRRLIVKAAVAAVCGAASLGAMAQAQPNWPTRTVTIVVPFSAGGSTDVVARMVGQKLSEMWKQTVVIDNRVGAGGNIGAAAVAKAPADGHTIMMASGSILTVNPHLYKNAPFSEKDFTPITNVATGPQVVVVPATLPVKNVKELIQFAKQRQVGLSMGSAGVGSQVHMAGENFVNATGIEVTHVPYRGEAPAYNDLMGGQIQLVVGNIAAVSALVSSPDSSRIRALAVTGTERSKLMPDVPTVAESGFPGFENVGWFGFVGPAGMPAAVVDKIYKDTQKVLESSEVRGRLFVQGMMPVGNAPKDFETAIAAESRKWADIIKARKLTAN
jgi:tripartite-type tricarboxylate transporter receptor subunit TctC